MKNIIRTAAITVFAFSSITANAASIDEGRYILVEREYNSETAQTGTVIIREAGGVYEVEKTVNGKTVKGKAVIKQPDHPELSEITCIDYEDESGGCYIQSFDSDNNTVYHSSYNEINPAKDAKGKYEALFYYKALGAETR